MPLVNERREVTGIFVAQGGGVSEKALCVPVVINAGGKGSRLDPFTRILPKPLIPIGDLPILEHIMRQFESFGCTEFHIIVNYKRQLIRAYFAECERRYHIQWYDEERPLGTGGGLSLLKGVLDGTFFFTNCDILVRSDYEQILNFHREQHSAVTMVCARKKVTIPYGVVDLGENGAIRSMREKPEMDFLTNTGMYVAEPEILADMEPDAETMESALEILEKTETDTDTVVLLDDGMATYTINKNETYSFQNLGTLAYNITGLNNAIDYVIYDADGAVLDYKMGNTPRTLSIQRGGRAIITSVDRTISAAVIDDYFIVNQEDHPSLWRITLKTGETYEFANTGTVSYNLLIGLEYHQYIDYVVYEAELSKAMHKIVAIILLPFLLAVRSLLPLQLLAARNAQLSMIDSPWKEKILRQCVGRIWCWARLMNL